MMPFFSFDDDEFFGDLLLMGAAGGGKAVEATATGNPLTFLTDLARPLKSLLIPFTPVQSGTGDPSPENIRPFVPWDGLSVFGGGGNLLNLNRAEGTPNPSTLLETPRVMDESHYYVGLQSSNYYYHTYADGSVQNGVVRVTSNANNSYGIGFPVAVKGGQKYTLNANAEKVLISFGVYDAEWNYLSEIEYKMSLPTTITIPQGATYCVIVFRSQVNEQYTYSEIQFEAGETATAYEPYKPITETDIVFPSPVYGGTLDVVSGVLTVDFAVISKKWSEFKPVGGAYGYENRTLVVTDDVLDAEHGGGTTGNHFCNCMIYSYAGASAESNHYFINTSKTIAAYMTEGTSEDADVVILAKLATPQEITLTPEQITALIGNNTIWSDADGSMTAVYLKKG